MPEMIVSFPHLGDYAAVFRQLFGRLFPHATIMPPPPISQKTLELGAKHSPDFVCSPFKYNLGNFIEALEQGANVLIQSGTGCRYGYYAELQEQILRDMGYDFQFVCFSRRLVASPRKALDMFRGLGCKQPVHKVLDAIHLALRSVRLMDRYAYWMRENMAFETQPSCALAYEELLRRIGSIASHGDYHATATYAENAMKHIKLNRPERPLRVGIVGEFYTLMEPFSNFDVEKHLIDEGISVSRRMGIWFVLGRRERRSLKSCGDYLRYYVGASSIDSVGQSLDYARLGYDGILHIKAFGCIPELNASPALMNVSRDKQIPMLSLSFDTHSSHTGMETRLEAFTDMLRMRREDQNDSSKAWRGHRLGVDESSGP